MLAACLAEQISCTTEKYQRLWKDELQWTPADERELARWKAIVADGERRAPANTAAPLLPNYLSYYPGLRFRQLIIATALDADSARGFRARAGSVAWWGVLVDARALAAALGLLWGDFAGVWWGRQPPP